MHSASDTRRFLGKLILVIFLVVHAPISGVMTAAQAFAHSGLTGAGRMVICLDGSFTEIAAPAAPQPNEYAAHDCLCPCATLSAKEGLAGNGSGAAAIFLETQPSQINWSAHGGPVRNQPPQSGRGSPRAPPTSIV